MKRLTKEQAIIISAYTGYLCCNFHEMHVEVEKRLGRPVLTHEFALLSEVIKEAFKKDFIALCYDNGHDECKPR